MKNSKKEKVEKELSVVRRASYTFLALAIFELSGIFALAGPKGLYVVTPTAANAFYPKKYVDVEIHEPNGQEYVIQTNDSNENEAFAVDNNGNVDNTKGKVASVKNAFGSKKDVIVRAKIVAEVYDETNQVYNEGLEDGDYKISMYVNSTYDDNYGDNTGANTWLLSGDGYYYYTSILGVGEETTNLFDKVTLTDTGLSKIPEGGYVKFNVIIDSLDAGVLDTTSDLKTNYWKTVDNSLATSWEEQREVN